MSQQFVFDVSGTTCASCEMLIERTLKEIKGVRSVHASHSKGTVTLSADDSVQMTAHDLDTILRPKGYRVRPLTAQREPLTLDLKKLGGGLVLILAVYLLLKGAGLFGLSPTSAGPTSWLAILGIGVVAAFSSCTAVVGGLLAAVSATQAEQMKSLSFGARFRPHILFNAGRLLGFVAFGALIGWLGQSVALSGTWNGLFVFLIAVVMVVLGINLLGVFSRPVFVVRPPKRLSHAMYDLSHSRNPLVPLLAGAGTFFLPCGFTQSMQLYALSLGNPWSAGLTMGLFALGTIPALLGVGALSAAAKGQALRRLTSIAGAAVIVIGFGNMANAAALLDLRVPTSAPAAALADFPPLENGQQVITMRVSSAGRYEPSTLTVRQGIPVRWRINGDSFLGCGDTVVLRAFNIVKHINPGANEIVFTPTKSGSFTFSCSMGMIRGTMVVSPSQT